LPKQVSAVKSLGADLVIPGAGPATKQSQPTAASPTTAVNHPKIRNSSAAIVPAAFQSTVPAVSRPTAAKSAPAVQEKSNLPEKRPTPKPLPRRKPAPQVNAEAGSSKIVNNAADLAKLIPIDEKEFLGRKFKEIDEEDSEEDSEPILPRHRKRVDKEKKDTTKALDKKRKRSPEDDGSSSDEVKIIPRPQAKLRREMKDEGKIKEKAVGKGKAKEQVDVDIEELKVIHSRPPASKKSTPRPNPITTGESYDQKCSHCRLAGRTCEKQKSGGACVNCRKFKHKCEYAKARKQKKSKPVVESEEEASSSPAPRPPRQAAAVAKKAIKDGVESPPKPRATKTRK
jgi:hypothetical protein